MSVLFPDVPIPLKGLINIPCGISSEKKAEGGSEKKPAY
jgi:hypothetical protein